MSGRCLSCNKILSDFEMCRKYASHDEYVGLCNSCFSHIKHDIQVLERPDLKEYEDWNEFGEGD